MLLLTCEVFYCQEQFGFGLPSKLIGPKNPRAFTCSLAKNRDGG